MTKVENSVVTSVFFYFVKEYGKAVRTFGGTLNYLPPETLLEGILSFKTDLWSLGALAFFVFVREHMITGPTKKQCLEKMEFNANDQATGYLSDRLEIFRVMNKDAMRFASQFLRPESTRAAIEVALWQPNELVEAAVAMTEGI